MAAEQGSATGLRWYSLALRWWRFEHALPARWRDVISGYPVVLLLGSGGEAQDHLIAGMRGAPDCVERSLPVFDDDYLGIYPGRGCVVLWPKPRLCQDDANATRLALSFLGRVALAGRKLVALALRDGAPAAPADPATLKVRRLQEQLEVQRYRHVLDALLERCAGTVPVRVALTAMDQRPGFAVLTRLLGEEARDQRLPLSALERSGSERPGALSRYEARLDSALGHEDPGDFRDLVAFLDQSAAFLDPLREPVAVLTAPGPTKARLAAEHLVLCGTAAQQIGAPFRAPPASRPRLLPLRWHLACAAALTLAGVMPAVALQHQHLTRLRDAEARVDSLTAAVPKGAGEATHGFERAAIAQQPAAALRRLAADDQAWWPFWRLTARAEKAAVRERYSDAVRRTYLLPQLAERGVESDGAHTSHWLALLYAAPPPEGAAPTQPEEKLYQVLRARRDPVATAVGMPEWLLTDYLELLTRRYQGETVVRRVARQKPWVAFWSDYLERLQRAMVAGHLKAAQVQAIRDDARAHLARLRESLTLRLALELFPLLKELSMTAGVSQKARPDERGAASDEEFYRGQVVDIRVLLGPEGERLDPLRWLSTWEQPLLRLLGPISAMALPSAEELAKRPSLVQLVTNLGQLNPNEAKPPPERVVIQVPALAGDPQLPGRESLAQGRAQGAQQHTFEFVIRDLNSTWGSGLISAYKAGEELPPLLGDGDGEDGAAPYTRETLLKVRQVVIDYAALRPKDGLEPREQRELDQYVRDELRDYAVKYRDHQRRELQRPLWAFGAESAASLPEALRRFASATSPLITRLLAVAHDGAVADVQGGWEGPELSIIGKELQEFTVLASLTAAQDGKYPALSPYLVLLQQLADELAAGGGARPTAYARLAQAERAGGEGSYGRRLAAFLREAQVPEILWPNLRAPLARAVELGEQELGVSGNDAWAALEREVRPLLVQFPFTAGAQDYARPEELAPLRRPDGGFWRTFDQALAPLGERRDGAWRGRAGAPRLDPEPWGRVTRLERLARLLWDDKGAPQPLRLQVVPLPLPRGSGGRVSVLRCGGQEIKGFNQRRAAQELQVPWWQWESASASLALAGTPAEPRELRQVKVDEAPWSCLRLLAQAERGEDGALWWVVSASGGERTRVGFEVTGDALDIIAAAGVAP